MFTEAVDSSVRVPLVILLKNIEIHAKPRDSPEKGFTGKDTKPKSLENAA